MTEAEWLAFADPRPMLEFMRSNSKTSDRKLRLFAVACCRCIWCLLEDDQSRGVVEILERLVDRDATRAELTAAHTGAAAAAATALDAARMRIPPLLTASEIACAAAEAAGAADRAAVVVALQTSVIAAAAWAAPAFASAFPPSLEVAAGAIEVANAAVLKELTVLLRDIFGLLPFRPVALDPGWRTPTVVALATAAYDERILPAGTLDPERLGVLADALEEAGCDNTDILSHLCGPGPHVRGCWALDLILGKQ